MESISNLLSAVSVKEKKGESSERASVIKEIYELYTSDQEKNFKKKENWKRFVHHCKRTNLPIKEKVVQEAFTKSNLYIKTYDIKLFCIRLSHIPTQDLYYVLSVSKDKYFRGQNISAWLFSSIKSKTI